MSLRELILPFAQRIRAWKAGIQIRRLTRAAQDFLPITPKPTLVIAPHPDDETFGCGGLIALKRKLGALVHIVFLTGGENPARLPPGVKPEQLVSLRKAEAVRAAHCLGVGEECLLFLDFPDSALARLHENQRCEAVRDLAALIRELNPTEIFLPHAQDRHADHETAHALTMEALRFSGVGSDTFQYLIWLPWLSGWRCGVDKRQLRRLNIESVIQAKSRAMQCYPSQLETLPSGFTSQFHRPDEVFCRCESSCPD